MDRGNVQFKGTYTLTQRFKSHERNHLKIRG